MICPGCKTDLAGGFIYDHFLAEYGGDDERALQTAAMYGASKGQGRWGREIAQYSVEEDRTIGYRCPDCGHEWERK